MDAKWTAESGPHCAQRKNWAVVSAAAVSWNSPIVGGGGVGPAPGAAGESEIRRFWTVLITESWLLGTELPAWLIRR